MEGAGGIEAATGGAGISSMTCDPTATANATEQLVHYENGMRLRSGDPEASRAPSDWRSRMERTMQQQAQELTQLHRTVRHQSNVLHAHATREEAQWLGMMTWMQEREQQWDACSEDVKLLGAGITTMVARVMKRVAPGHDARETERDKTAKMDGEGLEASQHADIMQEGGPEMRRQLEQQPEPNLRLKLQPKLQHQPKPKSAHTPAS